MQKHVSAVLEHGIQWTMKTEYQIFLFVASKIFEYVVFVVEH
jgi:hypothetical protein